MQFELVFSFEAEKKLLLLKNESHSIKRYKSVLKALSYLETNPKHPSLNTHKHKSFSKEIGQEGFEAYAENNCPGAYRIFWYYGPKKNMITIVTIVQHP